MAEVKSWSLDASADMLDDTALGDSWKSNIVGLKEWSASIEVSWDMSDTAQLAVQNAYLNGNTVAVKLYTNATNYYSGTANVSSLSVEDPVDDLVTATLEVQGSGVLSYN
jgi:predicted secreted protein